MLFSNKHLTPEERKFDFGTIFQVAMGEQGRGRKLLALTCPEGIVVEKGLNPNITIGMTNSGKPRIIKREDNKLYLLLSAKGSYTRKGNGYIQVLTREKDNFEVLASGKGADGEAGRIGHWACKLLKAPRNGIVAVQPSGKDYGIEPELYILRDGKVYKCEPDLLEECCEQLGLEEPYVLQRTEYDDYDWTDWSFV